MKFKIKYPFLMATLAVLALVITLLTLGAISSMEAFAMLCLGQMAIISKSKRRAKLCLITISEEQLQELTQNIMGIRKSLGGVDEMKADLVKLQDQFEEVKAASNRMRRASAGAGFEGRFKLHWDGTNMQVTEDCARHLGALAIGTGIVRGLISGRLADYGAGIVKEILGKDVFGVQQKASLTSADIPLPTEFSGQVVELVGIYGTARKYGTVYPLGEGQVKLPKLATDTTFGLVTQSVAIPEKSPQTAWVTFNAEKFGGLVRLPTEIDADSIVPMGQFIARYAARNIARVEDSNFFISTGADSGANGAVAGLTVSTITNSKVTQMATTKTHYSDATLANFQALRAVPDTTAIRKGCYYLNPTFEQLLASFNTGGNRPYNPTAQLENPNAAQPFIVGPTLDGFPVRWVDVMPAYSTSANISTVFALFGDVSFQYLGVRGGVRFDTSMDAGFTTDEILIRALERFTIGLMANGAVAGLETAAS